MEQQSGQSGQLEQSKNQPEKQKKKSSLIKFLRLGFYILFLAVFIWVIVHLFFEQKISSTYKYFRDSWLVSDEDSISDLPDLKVIYPQKPVSLEPTQFNPATRQILVNIYEPLVKSDMDLNLQPALALSWGLIDDYTWEFNLRPNVVFHDGSSFDVNDVISSFNRTILHPESEIAYISDSIEDFIVIDYLTFRLRTKQPDPLLLNKLTSILIIPSEYEDDELVIPIGTGSYEFSEWEEDQKILVKKFNNYWGESAKFSEVEAMFIEDISKRVSAYIFEEGDLLAFVPYDAIATLEEKSFELFDVPSLEVQFLLFNVHGEYLDEQSERIAIVSALDRESLVEELGDYVHSLNQFVSNGVFGFNPNIQDYEFDPDLANQLVEDAGLKGKTLQLHLPIGLDILGEYVRKALNEVGVNVIVSYLEFEGLIESMENKKADIYFLAFRAELGDSMEFLNSIVYSDGDFNLLDYENQNLDYLIETALVEMDTNKRRDLLQEAMRIIVEDDIVGVPLFEYEIVYSWLDWIEMQPRLDGLIYYDEINIR
jgi:peptide/nickel transport system substrate-binding protein